MTTPRESRAKAFNALAALIHEIRTDWDTPGIVAALRNCPNHLALLELGIAALRYAGDDKNHTPAHLADLANRAWDSDWYLPCQAHPETRARHHPTGECAACRSDRLGTTEPLPLRRQGVPPSPEIRQQLITAIGSTATGSTPRHADDTPGDSGCPLSGSTLDA